MNYVGHPIHGAASGFIWLDHEDGAHDPGLGFSKAYWASRGRAAGWAAAYSLQFEFGPMSEASIRNVSLRPHTTGWVDHIVTPAGAFGFMIAEDVLDRYLVARIESRTSNRVLRTISRVTLNPGRSLSNAAQGKTPWYRSSRRGRSPRRQANPSFRRSPGQRSIKHAHVCYSVTRPVWTAVHPIGIV